MSLILLFAGCLPDVQPTDTVSDESWFPGDEDADGYTTEEGDCDDADRTIHPGAAETWYDGIDQNCDGLSDDDQDGDGVEVEDDCDDADAEIFPGAVEECDEIDNNCDNAIDEGAEGAVEAYEDGDSDGWGDEDGDSVTVCGTEAPPGYSLVGGDCDDRRASVAPDAPELCDGRDNDCDGVEDEDPVDTIQVFLDADLDGYGEDTVWTRACEGSDGWAEEAGDCDDADPTVNPGADEYCNGVDEDCDGTADDRAEDRIELYQDADGDGYGDATVSDTACPMAGWVEDATDCDDADPAKNPGAGEACDGVDNDCDDAVDEDLVFATLYADADGDGHGDAASPGADACVESAGFVYTSDDCDDAEPLAWTGAAEVCDGVDNDCSGTADEAATDAATWYLDADGDSYGVDGDTVTACSSGGPGGYHTASQGGDCDDDDADRSPGATEADDGEDQDCDGLVDEDFVSVGDVALVEIARQPTLGTGGVVTAAQWFEIQNLSSRTLDLSGWVFTRTDATVGSTSFAVDPDDAPDPLEPGDLATFCATDLYTADNDPLSFLECDYVWGDASEADDFATEYLNNAFDLQIDADTLSLAVAGTTIDTVSWHYDESTDRWPRTAGYAMQLSSDLSDATSNDDYAAWCESATYAWYDDGAGVVEYGGPGTENEVCI